MPVTFAEYLASKFALDERSLNAEVRGAFLNVLHGLARIRCLDVGAGTGATLRRLLNAGLKVPLSVTALDRDGALIDLARKDTTERLRAQGLEPRMEGGAIRTEAAGPSEIRFSTGELKDHHPDHLYNVITAHAFLDIVPLRQALRLFCGWLEPGGDLYASINYDGETALTEAYEDAAFEAGLLDYYNHTMEIRRVDGQATGGAYCGRRLLALLPEFGFKALAHGDSDWDIAPLKGRYRDDDAVCLTALLEMILSEGQRSGLFHPDQLGRWHADRRRRVERGCLALRVHQTDVLARYEP